MGVCVHVYVHVCDNFFPWSKSAEKKSSGEDDDEVCVCVIL